MRGAVCPLCVSAVKRRRVAGLHVRSLRLCVAAYSCCVVLVLSLLLLLLLLLLLFAIVVVVVVFAGRLFGRAWRRRCGVVTCASVAVSLACRVE
jgi:hypothetical protein